MKFIKPPENFDEGKVEILFQRNSSVFKSYISSFQKLLDNRYSDIVRQAYDITKFTRFTTKGEFLEGEDAIDAAIFQTITLAEDPDGEKISLESCKFLQFVINNMVV